MTEPRRVLLSGPFSDDELIDIIAVVQRIERERPTETTFEVTVNAPSLDVDRFYRDLPLSPGYGRISGFLPTVLGVLADRLELHGGVTHGRPPRCRCSAELAAGNLPRAWAEHVAETIVEPTEENR